MAPKMWHLFEMGEAAGRGETLIKQTTGGVSICSKRAYFKKRLVFDVMRYVYLSRHVVQTSVSGHPGSYCA